MKTMKKKFLTLLLVISTLVLEILPYGAVCNFANPDGKPRRKTFSYFDLTPFGYANFAPLIVAMFTCVLLILTVATIVVKKQLKAPLFSISAIAALLSLAPLLLGVGYFSFVGAMISVLLLLTAATAFPNKRS